ERLKSEETVNDIIEEAAYTWFNRLMAIKILEANGYLEPTLLFAEGVRTPLIVQNAKKGKHNLKSKVDQDLLIEYLQEDKEEQAFGLLITDLCNRNKLLHDIFGRIDDYTEILLPQNIMQKDGLLDLINSDVIAIEDYKEVELIGWLYQFYISDKKDEVFAGFKKNKKARAEDIPAATQIFTPKWIVKYMVENTVGKIYLDYEPTSTLKEDMKYLVQNESDQTSDAIISDITELTLIDPASGS
ncbi:SAM-dependent methyltransferase, partial [Myroides odoratimimus]|nr:SAM-dependent methyltransferase [Myroides odoratimimus]